MKLTNNKIYSYAERLISLNINDIKMPVKINFFLQKNVQTVVSAGQEIEMARLNIAKEFGTLNDEGNQYIIPADKMSSAEAELNDLLNLEQDLNIHIFKLDDFDNIELTVQQLSAIMFMIEE